MKLFTLISLCLTFSAIDCNSAFSADIVMAFGEKIPPYCFPESNTGIELEVIGEALAFKGHVLVPRYYSLARIPWAFKIDKVDAAMTDLGQDLTQYGGYYGNPAVVYDNVFITLEERGISIKRPEDLKGFSVISFQGAVNRYPEWLEPVKAAGNYFEKNKQDLQVITLHKKRYDIVLSDRSIFKYYTALLIKQGKITTKPIREHRFVDIRPDDYRPVFKHPQIRDDFNFGLKKLKKSGRFQEIYDKYLN